MSPPSTYSLEIVVVRQQHPGGDVRRRLQRHARLALAAAREALLALAACLVAAVHEPRPDLRVDQPPPAEHARGVAAEPYQQHADHAIAPHVLEQRAGERWERRVGVDPRAVGGLEGHALGARPLGGDAAVLLGPAGEPALEPLRRDLVALSRRGRALA